MKDTIDIGRQRRLITLAAHVLVIVILFFLPELMMSYTRPHRTMPMQGLIYFKSVVYVTAFYIEYLLIIRCTLFGSRRRLWAFVGYNLLLVVVAMCLMNVVQHYMWQSTGIHRHRHNLSHNAEVLRQISMALRDLGVMVLTLALATAIRFGQRWKSLEKRHEQMVASQQADELRNLKSQLNPHFLFNTLNTIYSLIEISPREAQDAVHTLSKLLRYVLYENPSTVTMEQEMDFVRSYISLMQMRIGEDGVKADYSGVTDTGMHVAPLLFIALVENAFKHGNTGVPGQPVEISLAAADGVISCRTHNYVRSRTHGDAGGIGLTNLRRRLQLLYGENASLETDTDGTTYTAVLTIKNPDL